MRVQLLQVKEEPFAWKETLHLGDVENPEDGSEFFGPIDVEGEVSFVHPNFLFRARLRYDQIQPCDRCLEPTHQTIDTEIGLVVVVGEGHPAATSASEEQELGEDDFNIVLVDSEVLDTDPLVREHCLLGLPMKPLCAPDCQGLCEVCGEKAELGCSCEPETGDPRWAGLRELKDQLTEG